MSANILHSSKSSQWFTPPWVLDLVRDFVGEEIDLDPASCALANTLVRARRYYDGAEHGDGLSLPWRCSSLFHNPPYSRVDGGPVDRWVERAIAAEDDIRVGGAAVLNQTMERQWFRRLWQRDICIPDKRIRFVEPTLQMLVRDAEKRRAQEPTRVQREISKLMRASPDDLRERAERLGRTEIAPGLVEGPQPTHGNVIVRLAGSASKFLRVFGKHGVVVPADSARRAA